MLKCVYLGRNIIKGAPKRDIWGQCVVKTLIVWSVTQVRWDNERLVKFVHCLAKYSSRVSVTSLLFDRSRVLRLHQIIARLDDAGSLNARAKSPL